jgi:hypothetical protein
MPSQGLLALIGLASVLAAHLGRERRGEAEPENAYEKADGNAGDAAHSGPPFV